MTARRDAVDEPESGSSGGRALLIGAVVFAVAATGLLVLADEMRWLRLGIVAALWAALVGAFLAAKYRRQLADQEDVLAHRQELYELELEREIAARREYELEAVAEAKRAAEEQSRDDITALRGELQSLRTTLESLLGGEFLVERYALRAESTRMRSLPDDRQLKRLPAAVAKDEVSSVVREAETDLIERIREVHQAPRREPQRPQRAEAAVSQPLPKPQQRPDRPAGRPDRPAPEPVKRVEPVTQVRRPEPPPPHPAEVSDRWFIPGALDENGTPRRQPPRPAYDAWEPELPELSEIEEEWTPSWEAAGQAQRHEQPPPRRPEETPGHARADNGRYAQPADSGQYAVPPVDAGHRRADAPPLAAADAGRRGRPDSPPHAAADPGRRAHPDPADSMPFAAADAGRRARQDPAEVPFSAADAGRRARQDPAEPPFTAADVGRRARQDPVESVPFAADAGRRGHQDSTEFPFASADPGRRARQDPAELPLAAADPGRRARQEPTESVPFAEAGRRARQGPTESAPYAGGRSHQETELAMRPVEPPTHDTSKPVGHQSEQTSWLAQYNQPKPAPPERPDPLEYRARPYRTHAADSGQFPVVDDLPPSGRRHARTEPEGDAGGGRRRRAEGQPTWQELQSSSRNGHARPDPVEEPTGSHAAGRSVNELLATHGVDPNPRRRRRRED